MASVDVFVFSKENKYEKNQTVIFADGYVLQCVCGACSDQNNPRAGYLIGWDAGRRRNRKDCAIKSGRIYGQRRDVSA